tara:strand:+ start:2040 stop:3122 length:1083 start_codon:yes stop_codon:yes gene_type:complete
MSEKIKVALIGCGRISKNHIKSIIYHNSNISLVAICDSNQNRLNEAILLIKEEQEKYNLKNEKISIYDNFQKLIDDHNQNINKLDLVVLATPSGLHYEHTILAAENKINICTEKPMATKFKQGKEMVKKCAENGVKLFVVKQNRFNSTLQLLKKQIEKKRFGEIALVTVNVFWQRPQSYYDQDDWRGTIELDGGALMNQASHYVDLLDWLIGPVKTVSASIATISRKIEAEDTAAVQLKWENGALGTLAVTMLTFPKNLEGSITILGENGTVKIGGTAVNKIETWEFKDHSDDDKKINDVGYVSEDVYGKGHYPYYGNIISCLNKEEKAMCDGNDGLKSLELLEAAYSSAREERIVKLPL